MNEPQKTPLERMAEAYTKTTATTQQERLAATFQPNAFYDALTPELLDVLGTQTRLAHGSYMVAKRAYEATQGTETI